MSEWKLNRIRIKGFKAFNEFSARYDKDIIVYDGPNGFGKTSLFDAKQVLLTGSLPRINAKLSSIKWGQTKPKQSLYQHHGYSGDVAIFAEFIAGDETLVVMRKAPKSQQSLARKPSDLSHFQLYRVDSFDSPSSENQIQNEAIFWQEHFGENFTKNYTVLHYLPQDISPLLLPDESVGKQSRTNQIEHLFNLDELQVKLERLGEIKKITQDKSESIKSKIRELADELDSMASAFEGDTNLLSYTPLFPDENRPEWDRETPFTSPELLVYQQAIEQLDLLVSLVEQAKEVEKRYQNQRTRTFVETDSFKLAIILGNHIDKFEPLKKARDLVQTMKTQLETASKPLDEIQEEQQSLIELAESELFKLIKPLFAERQQLLGEQNTLDKNINSLISGREKLIGMIAETQSECPLCGFEYEEYEVLTAAIDARTNDLKEKQDAQGKKLNDCNAAIQIILDRIKQSIQKKMDKQAKHYNKNLLDELEKHQDKSENLRKIVIRLKEREIALPSEYSNDNETRDKQVSDVKAVLLAKMQPEDDSLTEQAYTLFSTYIKTPDNLANISSELVGNKKQYLQFKFNSLINSTRHRKQERREKLSKQLVACNNLASQLKEIEKRLNATRNKYINQTVGQIESLFHIYSGRLLQNYQCGLGVFIEMPTKSTQKFTVMRFTTPRLDKHDATLSMSSGQTSALSLALFLALNRRYAEAKFIFIDDPTQCMDEINIASLSDLLRVELRDRQVVLSTHESDIANYLTYRYEKAGLKHKTINLLEQTLAEPELHT